MCFLKKRFGGQSFQEGSGTESLRGNETSVRFYKTLETLAKKKKKSQKKIKIKFEDSVIVTIGTQIR